MPIPDKHTQERGSMKKVPGSDLLKKMMVLGEKEGSIKLKDLAHEMKLSPEETLGFLREAFPVGSGIEIYHKDLEHWVDIKGEALQYMLPLSPAEWIFLHQMLASQKTTSPAIYSLKQKMINGPTEVMMEIFHQLDTYDHNFSQYHQTMIHKMEEAIILKQQLNITSYEGRNYTFFPCKVLHLEGHLSLIAEDAQDHCLVVLPLKDVNLYEAFGTTSKPKITPFEIEEFIAAIRAMNEKETRLILKIHDPESANLFPDYQFLGKPCMITNPNGDLIWAAYVEPCDALFEWLITLGKKVEILDPIKFKDEYLSYCEEKLRKIA